MPCAHTPEEKQEQRSFFFWYKPEMKGALRTSLYKLGLEEFAAKLLGGDKDKTQLTPGVTYNDQTKPQTCGSKPHSHHNHGHNHGSKQKQKPFKVVGRGK